MLQKSKANLLKLNRSKFDINELVIKVSTEYQHIIDKENCKEDLKIITESSDLAILVEADRIKITPVMYRSNRQRHQIYKQREHSHPIIFH